METTNKETIKPKRQISEVVHGFRETSSSTLKRGNYSMVMEADILISKSDKSIEEQLKILKTLGIDDLRGATKDGSALNEQYGYKYDASGDK